VLKSAIQKGVDEGLRGALEGVTDKIVEQTFASIHTRLERHGMPPGMNVFSYVTYLQARITQLEAIANGETE
jgi:hypothetical protein